MKPPVRVIKSRARTGSETMSASDDLKLYRQTTREMVDNVKNWITQTKQRQRNEERKLAMLLK
jgi:hypothetical protein